MIRGNNNDVYYNVAGVMEEVHEEVRSFLTGLVGGPDGFRRGHLLELVGSRDEVQLLPKVMTDFTNLMLHHHPCANNTQLLVSFSQQLH